MTQEKFMSAFKYLLAERKKLLIDTDRVDAGELPLYTTDADTLDQDKLKQIIQDRLETNTELLDEECLKNE